MREEEEWREKKPLETRDATPNTPPPHTRTYTHVTANVRGARDGGNCAHEMNKKKRDSEEKRGTNRVWSDGAMLASRQYVACPISFAVFQALCLLSRCVLRLVAQVSLSLSSAVHAPVSHGHVCAPSPSGMYVGVDVTIFSSLCSSALLLVTVMCLSCPCVCARVCVCVTSLLIYQLLTLPISTSLSLSVFSHPPLSVADAHASKHTNGG